mgnify:CR=1 FL=1
MVESKTPAKQNPERASETETETGGESRKQASRHWKQESSATRKPHACLLVCAPTFETMVLVVENFHLILQLQFLERHCE